jgi:tRNA-N(6)-(isopentenyl)adenosine-37 thiotransferase enzyme MiaB
MNSAILDSQFSIFNSKYYILTFGCQMNVHDSEKLAGILSGMGYSEAPAPGDADVIVVNTCCIRDTAEKRIYGNIGSLKGLKKKNKNLIIAVVGCMTRQDGAAEALLEKFPFIDIILGASNEHTLGEKIAELLNKEKRRSIIDSHTPDDPEIIEDGKVVRTSFPNGWVNIMYGCDNFCSYCIVPYVRGRERSRDLSLILKEITELLEDGYKEITLLGQNVNSYKSNDYGFTELLKAAGALPFKYRLRFMTSHPKDFSSSIIDAIRDNKNIARAVHLPVQSGSDSVLKAMNRRYTRERYLEIISGIRAEIPEAGLTTDIMVGFPGETEDDFSETLDLVQKARFSNAFTFVYSPRKGTAAAEMEQIPYAVKKDRIARLIALQNKITREESETCVGKSYEVLAESEAKEGILAGRTESGRMVNFEGDKGLIGRFIDVKIERAKAAALWGKV